MTCFLQFKASKIQKCYSSKGKLYAERKILGWKRTNGPTPQPQVSHWLLYHIQREKSRVMPRLLQCRGLCLHVAQSCLALPSGCCGAATTLHKPWSKSIHCLMQILASGQTFTAGGKPSPALRHCSLYSKAISFLSSLMKELQSLSLAWIYKAE